MTYQMIFNNRIKKGELHKYFSDPLCIKLAFVFSHPTRLQEFKSKFGTSDNKLTYLDYNDFHMFVVEIARINGDLDYYIDLIINLIDQNYDDIKLIGYKYLMTMGYIFAFKFDNKIYCSMTNLLNYDTVSRDFYFTYKSITIKIGDYYKLADHIVKLDYERLVILVHCGTLMNSIQTYTIPPNVRHNIDKLIKSDQQHLLNKILAPYEQK